MSWIVEIGDEFAPEFNSLPQDVRMEILALARLLQHANMMRFNTSGGVWRVAFAFDVKRKAILLVAGDKSGVSERRFYYELIRKADERFDAHLNRLKRKDKEKANGSECG